jgi:hypothetical protein
MAEVDLHLLARCALHPAEGQILGCGPSTYIAFDGLVAAGKAVVFD